MDPHINAERLDLWSTVNSGKAIEDQFWDLKGLSGGRLAAGKAAPAHLHLSVAWTSGPVPSSWPDLLSSEAIEIVEPPTPAGYCSRGL